MSTRPAELSVGLAAHALVGLRLPRLRGQLLTCLALFFSSLASAQYPVIELQSIAPSAIQAGSRQTVRLAVGNQLDRVDRLLFSDPRITAQLLRKPPPADTAEPGADTATEPPSDGDIPDDEILWGQFEVHVPAELPAGRYEVRAWGAYGISNPRVLVVTDAPVAQLDAVSRSASEPTPVDRYLDADHRLVLTQQATAARVEHFCLTATDRPLRVTVDAQRIDSRMIAQIRLLDASGQLIKHVRGADGFDPAVVIPAEQGQTYTLAISDFLFRGGANYGYQLRIEPLDQDDQALSDSERLLLGGFHDPQHHALGPADRLELAALHPDLWSAPLARSQHEPLRTDNLELALTNPGQLVTPFPQLIAARIRFGQRANTHLVSFPATAGQTLTVEVLAQRVGVPADPRLSIQQLVAGSADRPEVWKTIASNDDQPSVGDAVLRIRSRDPVLTWTAPDSGSYRALVSSIDSGRQLVQSPAYRLVVRPQRPDFTLLAAPLYPHNDPLQTRPSGQQLKRGDSLAVRVLAFRHDGFAGPISLSVADLPAGVSCRPVTIAAAQHEATLVLHASESAVAWSGDLQVKGRDASDPPTVPDTVTALHATYVWGIGDQRDFIRSRLTQAEPLVVSDQTVVPLTLSLQPPAAQHAAGQGAAGQDASGQDSGDQDAGETLANAGDAADDPTAASAAATDGDQAIVDQAAALIAQPLAITATAGSELTVPVQLFRRAGATQPVILRARNLPPAATAAEVTIAADQSHGQLRVNLPANTPPGQYSCWFLGESRVYYQPITQSAAQEWLVFIPTTTVDLTVIAAP